jgi:hypothetical protein
MLARPRDFFVRANLEQKVELLGEESVVVLELQPEQRKGFDERSAPDNHLRAALGKKVQRGKLLEGAHGIRRTQNRHGTREPDPMRPCRSRREDHGRRGIEKIPAMVLSDAENIETNCISMFDASDKITQGRGGIVGKVRRTISEGGREAVNSEFHGYARLP